MLDYILEALALGAIFQMLRGQFSQSILQAGGSGGMESFACYGAALVLAGTLMFLYDERVSGVCSGRVGAAATLALGLAGVALPFAKGMWASVFAGMLLALFVSLSCALLAERLARFEAGSALSCVTLGFLLSFALSFIEPYGAIRTVATFAMPVVVCVALLASGPAKAAPSSLISSKPGIPVRFILTIAAFVVAGNLLVGLVKPGMASSGSAAVYLSSGADACIGVAVLLAIKLGAKPQRVMFWSWSSFSMGFFLGVVLMTCPSAELSRAGSDVVTTFRVAVEFLLFALIVLVARREHVHAMGPVGLFVLVPFGISVFLRHVLAFALLERSASAVSGYLPTIVVMVALIVLFSQYSFANKTSFNEYFSPAEKSTERRLDAALDALCEGRGITPREREVLAYTAQGYTMKATAEKLVISLDTVRTHSKSIFRKLGVHSKQEVIDFVNSYPR